MMHLSATNNSREVFADTHIRSSIAMIAEASALAGSGPAAVLGCGYCGEIPLQLLNQTFAVVDLVDINSGALAAIDARRQHWHAEKNVCQFHRADLTGIIATIAPPATALVEGAIDPSLCLEQLGLLLESTVPEFWSPPQSPHYDFLVCSMVLTQLQAVVRESVEKIYLARFPEHAAALVKHESWCKSAWNFARTLEEKFLAHLATLMKPHGIVYLSETVHVSWLTQLDGQSVFTEGSWITLRTPQLADYLSPGDTIIREQHWDWLREEREGNYWGRLYRVQAIIYRTE